MRVKNVSGVQQRIITPSGEIRVQPNACVDIPSSRFNPRYFVEVSDDDKPKSAVALTEADNRTFASDMEPVVMENGKIAEKLVDEAAPKAEEPMVAPSKPVEFRQAKPAGRPKKLA